MQATLRFCTQISPEMCSSQPVRMSVYIYIYIAHDNICKTDHAMPTITRRTRLRYSSLDTVPEIPQLNSTAWLH